ncbi:hypothetical protein N656DRAFT_86562 [Canariomyces notabilis]|uniref:Uncharacterized protein n=1 Tax=Canariomyces notabilis TaxID=2074819 RepID=A0AAN6TDD5_9PEZI|nr:hypothetical protein N656DRAFT_86562 [Canariomyces arenarius]
MAVDRDCIIGHLSQSAGNLISAKREDGARCQMHYCVPIYCTAQLRRLRMAHAGSAGCLLLVVVELAFVGLQTGPLGHRMLSCR